MAYSLASPSAFAAAKLSFRGRASGSAPLTSGPNNAARRTNSAALTATKGGRWNRVLRVACEGESAGSWIDNWKKRDAARKEEQAANLAGAPPAPMPTNAIFAKRFARAKGYHYVYVLDVGQPESNMEVMYWKDTFASRNVDLHILDPNAGTYTLSNAQDLLKTHLAGQTKKVRLMGNQVGAYVCALYAAENPENINSIFLIEPAFALLELAQGLYGDAAPSELLADAEAYAPYPFVRCPSYVVHGSESVGVPFDNSLAWVRGASINMRGGRVGVSDELVSERRLLEISNGGQGLDGCLSDVQKRLLDYWELTGDQPITPSVNLEDAKPEDFARPHSYNFEQYDEFLKKFEAERDRRERLARGEAGDAPEE